MNRESDQAYFERRAREERDKAENAPDPMSYRLHLNFAREYERRVQAAYRDGADRDAESDPGIAAPELVRQPGDD